MLPDVSDEQLPRRGFVFVRGNSLEAEQLTLTFYSFDILLAVHPKAIIVFLPT